ncbi:MAG: hypothetical protein ACXV2C_08210, partial [Candidatus Bathyarchaeia archaeon]
ILTYVILSQLAFSNLLQLIIGVFVFSAIFIVVAILTKTINRVDVNNLREIINGLGAIRKIFSPLLTLVEKLMDLLHA